MPVIEDQDIVRGDTYTYILEVKNEDKEIVNLTGATIWYTVKESYDQTDNEAIISLSSDEVSEISIHDPTNGLATVYILDTHTDSLEIREYVYDVQVKTTGGDVKTVLMGKWIVAGDVTRSTS